MKYVLKHSKLFLHLLYLHILLASLFSTIHYLTLGRQAKFHTHLKLNSVACSPQANYTDRATAAC
jgi:hypothetical protein